LIGGAVFDGLPLEQENRLRTPEPTASRAVAEADVVQGCRSGSLPAFERLYELYGARMKSVACNLLGNSADAEDAVQDAFLKIFRSVEHFKGDSALSTWIYRILVNACYDLMRKRRRRQEEANPAAEQRSPTTPAVGAPDHPLRLALEKSLARLKPRNRTVFLLFEVEGLKHREIAEVLDIPEGTSKNLLFEAKRELHRLLASPGSSKP
jgi:RNA polymerase sigma-70 factor (ECF subfamily)